MTNLAANAVGTGSQVAAWVAIGVLTVLAVVLVAANWTSSDKRKGPRR